MVDGKIKQVTVSDGRAALERIRRGEGTDEDYNAIAALLDRLAGDGQLYDLSAAWKGIAKYYRIELQKLQGYNTGLAQESWEAHEKAGRLEAELLACKNRLADDERLLRISADVDGME